ncbi:MAG: response regulator [Myxococcales bacterium]|nr:response regulator [Myxococcales bacterium]
MNESDMDLEGIEPRARRALEVILQIAGGDYSARAQPSDRTDSMDAVSVGLNMLAETLERERDAKQRAEARLADALDAYDNAPDWFCSCEAGSLSIVKCNDTMATALGMTAPELAARSLLDLVQAGSRAALEAAVARIAAGEPSRSTDVTLALPKPVVASVTGNVLRGPDGQPVRFRLVLRDVTVERQLEDQLVHAQRMEAIGRLAGGVAHDFNNLLTVIQSAADLVSRSSLTVKQERELGLLREAADRAAVLTRDLLAFSRREVGQPRALNVDETLIRAEPLLSRLAGRQVTFELRQNAGAAWVQIDPSRLEQVLVNLVVNARDAMPDGGTVVVVTRDLTTDAAFADRHPDVAPGRYVEVTVSDTGPGIPPAVQSRIFEPFFTTKPSGKGTGLGLSTVYGITRQAGGYVTVESLENQGSTFRVLLPVVADTPAPPSSPEATARETILVVEDDDRVRAITTRILREGGFHVLEASGSAAALELFDGAPGIALVVSDVVMPGLSGPEAVARMRRSRPDLRCLFVTGFSHESLNQTTDSVLSKPFLPSALLAGVRDALSR